MSKKKQKMHFKKALIRNSYIQTHRKIKLNFIQILKYYHLHTHCNVQIKTTERMNIVRWDEGMQQGFQNFNNYNRIYNFGTQQLKILKSHKKSLKNERIKISFSKIIHKYAGKVPQTSEKTPNC